MAKQRNRKSKVQSLHERLKAIERATKRTRKSKTKKGVRVKNPKFDPLKASRLSH